LIASVEKTPGGVQASVRPTRLPITHPLASVSGATNAITFTTALLGDVTLIAPAQPPGNRLRHPWRFAGD